EGDPRQPPTDAAPHGRNRASDLNERGGHGKAPASVTAAREEECGIPSPRSVTRPVLRLVIGGREIGRTPQSERSPRSVLPISLALVCLDDPHGSAALPFLDVHQPELNELTNSLGKGHATPLGKAKNLLERFFIEGDDDAQLSMMAVACRQSALCGR